MEATEIIEGNKLLMAFESPEHNYSDKWLLEACKYHTSWDWLMSVVEKIESMGNSVTIEHHSCEIEAGVLDAIQIGAKTKIEATWLAVVDFVKFYNQNK